MDITELLKQNPYKEPHPNHSKIILDLCGGTGSWSKPYTENGYDVRLLSLPTDIRLIYTYEEHFAQRVYGILAAPPCTVFANSGVQWYRSPEEMIEGISILDACIRFVHVLRPHFWALENPIGKVTRFLGPPRYKFDPCDHGDPYTKKTYIWGNFNIPSRNPISPTGKNPIHYAPPNDKRQELRSITPAGFAQAFYEANQ